MKAISYIFAIVFSLTVSTSFATDKIKNTDKKPTTKVLQTEIASLIEEVATSESDRNLVLDSLEIDSNVIMNLIEQDAQNEVDAQLDVCQVVTMTALENLAETNANQEVNSTLHTPIKSFCCLQNLIEMNANSEVNAKLK
jgi:hypothetical protein